MQLVIGQKDGSKFAIFSSLCLIKILYVVLITLMLPEQWELWDFNKCITVQNVCFEIIPFFIGTGVFLYYFVNESTYSFFLTIFFVIYFIPNNSTMVLSNYELEYYCLVNFFSIFLMIVIGRMAKKDRYTYIENSFKQKFFYEKWQDKQFLNIIRLVMLAICAISVIRVYLYNGLNFSFLLSDMYLTRADYAAYYSSVTDTMGAYVILVVSGLANWFLLVCLYYSIMAKKIIDIALCLFTYFALFTMDMQKSTLMILVVVYFVCWMQKRKKRNFSTILICAFIVFFIIMLIAYAVNGESKLFTLFVRRLFYMPTYLTKVYYDFFKENSKLWFSQDFFLVQNIWGKIIGRSYSTSAVTVISKNCFDGLIPSPNNGLFTEAFAQLGIVGVFVFPFIHGFIVKKMKNAASLYGSGVELIILTKLFLTMTSNMMLASSRMVGLIIFIGGSWFIRKIYKSNN